MNTEDMRKAILNNPDVDADMLIEARDALDKELKKPYKKRDNERIEELTDIIYRLTSSDDIETVVANGIEKLYQKSEVKTAARPRKRWIRLAVVSAACLLVLFCANIWTVQALDLNVFQTVYHIMDGSVEIHFGHQDNSEEEIILTVSEDDPYGIRAKCEEYGFSPLTPSYIPAEFKLVKIDSDSSFVLTHLYFYYKKGNEKLDLYYSYVSDPMAFTEGTYGLPSDHHQFSEEIIGGYTVFISWEDQQFTAIFSDDEMQISYTFQSVDIEYEEAMKVLSSLFK